jgi:hypothetical protein
VYREASQQNLPLLAIDLVPSGVRLRFTGIPGLTYHIQRALAVTGPWSIIATLPASPDGFIEYVDPNPPVVTAFYRTNTP